MINETKYEGPGGEMYSQRDLEQFAGPDLVALYNVTASNLDEPSVRKFKDLATGRKRVWGILERYETWLKAAEEQELNTEDEEDFDADFDDLTLDKPKEKIIVVSKKKAKKVLQDLDKEEKDFLEKVKSSGEQSVKKKKRQSGVGDFIRDKLVNTNETPEQIIEAVRIHFPDSKASTKDVAWYKCKLPAAEKENTK